MIDLECQCQHLHHIRPVRVATHFWSDSLGLLRNLSNIIKSDIASDIAVLTLTLSVNGPLFVFYLDRYVNSG